MVSISLKRSYSGWTRFFPCLSWLPKINRHTLKADFVAGLTVALVAIPQSLAYAQLAGVPAYYGLYAALLPVIVGALLGSSPLLSTGPVAMTSLLTAASVMTFAPYGSEQFYSYVILIALLSGIIQIGLGVGRMGRLINFLSYPVLHGFINAAAIIIGLSQLPAMLGLKLKNSEHFLSDILHVIEHFDRIHLLSMAFGVTALILLLVIKKIAPKLPGVLIVVSLGILASWLIGFETDGGKVVGVIPRGLPSLSMPKVNYQASMHLLPAAFVIAIISFMEAMSSSKIIAIKTRTRWDENQELIGQGCAKIMAAFSHSMPVSGSFSRSALNLIAGAKTGLASVFSAGMVLIVLLFFTPVLYHLPKPVLSAVIMAAVFNLLNFKEFRDAWRARKDDGIAAVVTFFATLLFAPNIQNGILTGMILSLIMFLYRTMQPDIVILGKDEQGVLRDAERFNLPKLHPRLMAIRFTGHLYFANVAYVNDSVLRIIGNDPELRIILIVGDGINSLDASGVEMFINLRERLQMAGITLAFCNLRENVTSVMQRTGLDTIIGRENIFVSENQALDALNRRLNGVDQ
ncbi:MAG TPA: SulP family inorganic anion transporter [Desulfobulbus sp.]|nr:SulP family inorganic anion transporter [Desulfobulbus sp.]